MRGSYLNISKFNTIGVKQKQIDRMPEPPALLDNKKESIDKHIETLKNFINEYTTEILTRKDFKLLNNVFKNTLISEKELDEMEVAGDGFEHMHVNNTESNADASEANFDFDNSFNFTSKDEMRTLGRTNNVVHNPLQTNFNLMFTK